MRLRYIAEAGKPDSSGRKSIYTPRTEELAKEIGILPKTLKEYFRLGCPQTSVEDIKKWREEHVGEPRGKQIYTPRIEELAKELGLSTSSLRHYFRLGCPQTSAEDIKKWREEYVRIHNPRIKELAKELGVHPELIRYYFKLGCPQTSAEDIKKWREEHVRKRGRKPTHNTSRIKELAKETGLSAITLRRYFKLGCPLTSVEDVKKWREEYLRRPGTKQTYTPRIKELAKELGVHPELLRRYFKLGCPQTSAEDIKKWREEYLRRPGRKKRGRKPTHNTSRIKELAKEAGLSAITLRRYFKLGCPQTSAEDIKKWREEYVRIRNPRIKELAKEIGISPLTLQRYSRLGCPLTSAEDIKKWREEYVRIRNPRIKELAKEIGISPLTLQRYSRLGCPLTSAEDIKKWREEYIRTHNPRIKELAKEIGIHPFTLKQYFKLGCPQTSAEDIKKWREEHVRKPGFLSIYTPRIEELAKETGLSAITLRKYFKLGCPQTSAEDIKKWREEHVGEPRGKQIYTPRIEELAKETGLSTSSLREYFKLGCPQTSAEDIKKWREEHVGRPGREPIFTPPHMRELAKETGLSTSSLREYFKLGCPQTSAEDIKKWREEHVRKRYKSQNPAEQQAIISRITRRRAEGAKLQEIADELNADGIRTWNGKQWTPGLVHWAAEMARSRQQTTESKRDFRSLLESILSYQ